MSMCGIWSHQFLGDAIYYEYVLKGDRYSGTKAIRTPRAPIFMEQANEKDTYFAMISPGIKTMWEAERDKYKNWIVYEGPMAFNTFHPERTEPSIQCVILEKPLNWKKEEAK